MTVSMYCPSCGKEDQTPETYCRQCGKYLADPDKNISKTQTPREQFNVSLGFNVITTLFSLGMAIALIIVHAGMEGVHGVIYASIATFFVIALWQTGSFFNNLKLKKRYQGSSEQHEVEKEIDTSRQTNELPPADMSDFVPASVTEKTTRDLSGQKLSAKTEKKPD